MATLPTKQGAYVSNDDSPERNAHQDAVDHAKKSVGSMHASTGQTTKENGRYSTKINLAPSATGDKIRGAMSKAGYQGADADKHTTVGPGKRATPMTHPDTEPSIATHVETQQGLGSSSAICVDTPC
jgi:hypothetical protein